MLIVAVNIGDVVEQVGSVVILVQEPGQFVVDRYLYSV
jgi:hypothetical protein